MEYRDTGTYTIRVDEAVTQMLDDHIVMLQAMAFSPYKKPFEERIARWESSLALASETLDEWQALQRSWMYLEPIFSSQDILKQLPAEGKRFSAVDRNWRKAASAARSTKHVISCCSSKRQLDVFAECNRALDAVQKARWSRLERFVYVGAGVASSRRKKIRMHVALHGILSERTFSAVRWNADARLPAFSCISGFGGLPRDEAPRVRSLLLPLER